ncbi:uncharacterized protein LOC119003543 isoform X4 [Sturnira hondurensis]|uniref:uncharacterized protein LOC119003543 isoform X4 n=1 Tax=Sturnira hondurensis TaxID=192404 RepID=UPI00187AA29F|nr:uncharacterized protein LOC119003543 isoform X4 [Sturnira hondurensis]
MQNPDHSGSPCWPAWPLAARALAVQAHVHTSSPRGRGSSQEKDRGQGHQEAYWRHAAGRWQSWRLDRQLPTPKSWPERTWPEDQLGRMPVQGMNGQAHPQLQEAVRCSPGQNPETSQKSSLGPAMNLGTVPDDLATAEPLWGNKHLLFVGAAKLTEVAKLGTTGGHPVLYLRMKLTRKKELREGKYILSRHQ